MKPGFASVTQQGLHAARRQPLAAWTAWCACGALAASLIEFRHDLPHGTAADWLAAARTGGGVAGLVAAAMLAALLMAKLVARRGSPAVALPARGRSLGRYALLLVFLTAGAALYVEPAATLAFGALTLLAVAWNMGARAWRRRLTRAAGRQQAASRPGRGRRLLVALHRPGFALALVLDDVLRGLGFALRRATPWLAPAAAAWGVAIAGWLLVAPLAREQVALLRTAPSGALRLALIGPPSPRVATDALALALAVDDEAGIDQALRAGAREGAFALEAGKLACPAWLHAGRRTAAEQQRLLRQALARTGIQLSLDASLQRRGPTTALLRQLAQCELDDTAAWPLAEWTAAAVRVAPGLSMPLAEAAAVGHPVLTDWALRGGGSAAADWQGRTPAMAALEALAAMRDAGASQRRLAFAQANVERLLPDAGHPPPDRAGRSLAYLLLRAGIAPERAAAWLDAQAATSRTAAGETLAHALARAGAEADAWAAARRLMPGAPGLRADAVTPDGTTPLHVAHGAAAVALLLAAPGADPDRADAHGRTPLHAAVLRRDLGATTELLRWTSARERRDDEGHSAADDMPPPATPDPWAPQRAAFAERAAPGWPP